MSALRIAGNAARVGFAETRAQYTWRSWLFGWVTRLVAQTLFFTAIGVVVDSSDLVEFAFIGNVAAIVTLLTLGIGPDTAWERAQGTLPLLMVAPRSMLPVFAGRNLFHVVQGLVEALVVFALVAPWIGVAGDLWWLPVALIVIALGSYGLGLSIAAMSIRRVRIGNILYNLIFWSIVAIGGVNVPRVVFPGWVQAIGQVLPLVNGLEALRVALAGGPTAEVLRLFGLELAVGAGWFIVAMAGFAAFVEGGREDGTIDLAE